MLSDRLVGKITAALKGVIRNGDTVSTYPGKETNSLVYCLVPSFCYPPVIRKRRWRCILDEFASTSEATCYEIVSWLCAWSSYRWPIADRLLAIHSYQHCCCYRLWPSTKQEGCNLETCWFLPCLHNKASESFQIGDFYLSCSSACLLEGRDWRYSVLASLTIGDIMKRCIVRRSGERCRHKNGAFRPCCC